MGAQRLVTDLFGFFKQASATAANAKWPDYLHTILSKWRTPGVLAYGFINARAFLAA